MSKGGITFFEKMRGFARSQSFRDPSEWTKYGTNADSCSLEGDPLQISSAFYLNLWNWKQVTKNVPLKRLILLDWE